MCVAAAAKARGDAWQHSRAHGARHRRGGKRRGRGRLSRTPVTPEAKTWLGGEGGREEKARWHGGTADYNVAAAVATARGEKKEDDGGGEE